MAELDVRAGGAREEWDRDGDGRGVRRGSLRVAEVGSEVISSRPVYTSINTDDEIAYSRAPREGPEERRRPIGENLRPVPKSRNAGNLAERNDFSDVARLRFTTWE